MTKFFSWLSANGDKVLHFAVCLVVAIVVAALDVRCFGRETAVAAAIGALTAVFLGVAKEVWDFLHGGRLSLGDLAADAAGALAGFALSNVAVIG